MLKFRSCVTLFTHYSPPTQNTKENRQDVSKEFELYVRRPVSTKPSVYFSLLTKITWLKNQINVITFKNVELNSVDAYWLTSLATRNWNINLCDEVKKRRV